MSESSDSGNSSNPYNRESSLRVFSPDMDAGEDDFVVIGEGPHISRIDMVDSKSVPVGMSGESADIVQAETLCGGTVVDGSFRTIGENQSSMVPITENRMCDECVRRLPTE